MDEVGAFVVVAVAVELEAAVAVAVADAEAEWWCKWCVAEEGNLGGVEF